jgi:hypothetical protein
VGCGGLGFCISNELPAGADAAALGPTLGVVKSQQLPTSSHLSPGFAQ